MVYRITHSLRITHSHALLLSLILLGGLASGPLHADAPQFTVEAANWSINPYSPNWACDGSSDLSHGSGCYGQYAASTVQNESPRVVQNPSNGEIYFYSDGPERDGGFLDPQKYDTNTSWLANGAQGGAHKLREVRFELDNHGTDSHYVINSAFYDAARGEFILPTGVFDTGDFPNNTMSGLIIGHGQDGLDNWSWWEIFRSNRPSGSGSGAEYHFNKAAMVKESGTDRYLGMMRANNSGVQDVLTPFYVDWDRQVVGFLFTNEGWCEYPWGFEFDDFDTGATCATSQSGGHGDFGSFPDTFRGIGTSAWPLAFKGIWTIDAKIIALRTTGATQPSYDPGDALCPPETSGFDHDLYASRTRDPQHGFDSSETYNVREVATSTWNVGSPPSSVVWTGGLKTILDGNQAQRYYINPTDSAGLGSFNAELFQRSDGTVYLYLSAKYTFCEPDSSPSQQAWDRFPKTGSGSGIVWFRLSY